MERKTLFRRLIATAMAALMLTSSMSVATNAAQLDSAVSVSSTVSYSGTCNENVNWALYDDGTLVISGTGEMFTGYGNAPWYEQRELIKSVVIENGVTTIGNSAFIDCVNATNFEIAPSVTYVASSAFSNCTALETIVIPDSVTEMSIRVFAGCTNLKNVTLSEGLTTIPQMTFQSCASLKTLDLPKDITKISDSAFYESGLESIIIPENVKVIEYGAFIRNNSLKYVEIQGAEEIFGSAFEQCENLETVIIADGIKEIYHNVFKNCKSLKNVSLGEGLNDINSTMFNYCSSLETITIPASCKTIEFNTFNYCTSIKNITMLGKNTKTIGGVSGLSTITGYVGSTAEVYSENSGCTFVPLNTVSVGDVDCDEDITVADATELQFFLSKSVSFTKSQIALSDVNGDGEVDIDDVTQIQMYLAKLIDGFGV